MNPMNPKTFMVMTLIAILLLICAKALFGKELDPDVLKEKNYCVIQIIYSEQGELIEKTLVCRDGNVGPSYWDLFAEFYYSNADNVPEYCRYLEGIDHAFKIPQKVCLKRNGQWESEYND